jgi:hypothetical protein
MVDLVVERPLMAGKIKQILDFLTK